MKKNNYTVVVGNVGNMEYTSKKLALECYKTYVSLSQQDSGRAAGESVTLLENDNILREFIGENDAKAAAEENGFLNN